MEETSAAWASQTVTRSDNAALHEAASSSGFDPVGVTAAALEAAHATTGLPWWATIACGAVAVRVALFPFTVKQAKAGALLNTAIARARTGTASPLGTSSPSWLPPRSSGAPPTGSPSDG